MRKAWNKGLTKDTDESVASISKAFTSRRIDNFASWRRERDKARPKEYYRLIRNGDLAELLGVVLGDGYIGQHARTQVLRIVSNSKNEGFVERYSSLVEKVFAKSPRVRFRKDSNCADIVLYQNNIASRLGLETGSKTRRPFVLPDWITASRHYKIRFLRGLYESDGCLAFHAATYTHKFIFSNVNPSLLDPVFMLLCELGFHPTKTRSNVQLSRRIEVAEAAKLLKFRKYI